MNKYINVVDKELCETLLEKGYKLLNSTGSDDNMVWTFKFEPRFFDADFGYRFLAGKYTISDTLKLTF